MAFRSRFRSRRLRRRLLSVLNDPTLACAVTIALLCATLGIPEGMIG